jgi:hypothetical protein
MVGSSRLMPRTERPIRVYIGIYTSIQLSEDKKIKKIIQNIVGQALPRPVPIPTSGFLHRGAPPAVLVRCSCAPSGSGRRPSLWSATRFTPGQAERQDEKHLECADLSALCRFRPTTPKLQCPITPGPTNHEPFIPITP